MLMLLEDKSIKYMAQTNSKVKEITTNDVLTAYKNGVGSKDWEEILSAKDLSAEAASLRDSLSSGTQLIEYQKATPENFNTNIQDIKDKANRAPRGTSQIFSSENGSVALKDDGTISLAAGTVSHLELDPGGNLSIQNVDTDIKTNFFSVAADDIIVNNHKLNQKIYELADFKKIKNTYDGTIQIAGNLTMLGTVLVKAWEPNLQRYVLVRRQINMPVFSPSIGGAEVNPGLNITPDTEFIRKFKKSLDTSGISSLDDLMSGLERARAADIMTQEKATAAQNEATKKENAAKQVTSMTTLTGQDPTSFGASQIIAGTNSGQYGGGGGSFGSSEHGGGGGGFGEDVVKNASQFPDGYQWMDPTGTNKDARNQCASFASQMMKAAGIDIEVVVNGDVLANQFKQVGAYHTPSSGYQPQSGDLIDWAHHVGIYAGNGQYIARNSSGGVKRGSMAGMEAYFGSLWGYGSVAELQKAKGHKA